MSALRPGLAVLAAALVALAGCGGSDGVDAHIELVAPDNNIRVEGSECAGATPFEYAHATAPFTLETEGGTVLAEGELPAGEAENADPTIDWGVERIPTVCIFELTLEGLEELPRYQLRVGDSPPIAFDASLLSDDEPLRLFAQ